MASGVEQQRQMAAERRRIQREEIIEGVDTTTPPFSGSHDDLTDVTAEQHHDLVTLSAEADAVLELAGQELDLDEQAANTVFKGPDAGAPSKPTFAPLVAADIPAIGEGPGIDIIGRIVGLGGDTILLYDSGGDPIAEYPFTSDGLIAGLAAMAAGDVLEQPAGTITGGPWTLAAGTLRGLSQFGSIIDGQLTLSDATHWENMSLIRSVDNADTVYGLVLPLFGGVAYVKNCIVSVTQVGAGYGIGINTLARGDLGTDDRDPGWIHSYVYGSTNDIV